MAGIVSATDAQVQTARDKVHALYRKLQDISQGPLPPKGALSAQQIVEVDAIVDAAVAAIAPLNT
jgi:hypothetical protein